MPPGGARRCYSSHILARLLEIQMCVFPSLSVPLFVLISDCPAPPCQDKHTSYLLGVFFSFYCHKYLFLDTCVHYIYFLSLVLEVIIEFLFQFYIAGVLFLYRCMISFSTGLSDAPSILLLSYILVSVLLSPALNG